MKLNYEQKQGQLAQEGQPTRGWLIYWEDMLKNGEWADDTFVQATAFFLNLDFFLVIADSATYTQLFHPISGDIDSDRVGSPGRPTLLIGYISDQHYQSLLLAEEEPSVSGCPTSQAVDEALRRAFSALQLELLKQSRQVSWIFKMVLSNWKLISLKDVSNCRQISIFCNFFSIQVPSLAHQPIQESHAMTSPQTKFGGSEVRPSFQIVLLRRYS